MFKKILVAEDVEIANFGIIHTLVESGLVTRKNIKHTQYCDTALSELKRALFDDLPFDLLITDLSFEKNFKEERIISGYELIIEARKIQNNIKIIVYSIEDRISKIRFLFFKSFINGYVCKDGHDATELVNAVNRIAANETYIPPGLRESIYKSDRTELTDYQKKLLTLLAEGHSQKNVEQYFKQRGIKPNSISMIEKKLEKLRDDFNANSTPHLIVILKDFGLL